MELVILLIVMIMRMMMMMMMVMMMIVKNTPAHVYESYSCWYNISVQSVNISWHVTFGLHTGPLSDTLKSTADGL